MSFRRYLPWKETGGGFFIVSGQAGDAYSSSTNRYICVQFSSPSDFSVSSRL